MLNLSAIIVLVFVVAFCPASSALFLLKLESIPGTIHPVLAKYLQITCIVQNKNFNGLTTTSPWTLLNSRALQGSQRNHTADTTATPAPISSMSEGDADISTLLSLTVTKQNPQTGLNETIASVVGCDTPVVEKDYVDTVKVEGNTESSSTKGELGYIRLTWDRPVDKHAGLFNCEANALDSDKHSVALLASLKVDAVEPKISDLVNYISTNDKYISDLKSKVSEIYEENRVLKQEGKSLVVENTKIISRLDRIKSPRIQTGTLSCDSSSVKFNPVFNCTPKVFTSLSTMNSNGNVNYGNYGNGYFSMSITSVTNASFVNRCSVNTWLTSFTWFAIELCD